MEGKKLNALPKVTTLADGDTLLAIDSGGGGKRISQSDFRKQGVYAEKLIAESGHNYWVNIASFPANTAAAGLILLSPGLWSGRPRAEIFAIGSRYWDQKSQNPSIRCLTGLCPDIKMRAYVDGDKIRIDALMYSRKFTVNILGGNLTIGDLAFNQIPDNVEQRWNYDFSVSESGGVMLSFSNGCNLLVTPRKGGGLRNGRKDYNRGDAEVVIADADSVFARDCSERKPEQCFGAGTVLPGSENADRHSDDKQVWSADCAASGKWSDIAVCDFGWYGTGISDEDWKQSHIVEEGNDNYRIASRKEVAYV